LHTTGSAQALNGFGQPMVSLLTRRANVGISATALLLLSINRHGYELSPMNSHVIIAFYWRSVAE
jgi:hypothetical protein